VDAYIILCVRIYGTYYTRVHIILCTVHSLLVHNIRCAFVFGVSGVGRGVMNKWYIYAVIQQIHRCASAFVSDNNNNNARMCYILYTSIHFMFCIIYRKYTYNIMTRMGFWKRNFRRVSHNILVRRCRIYIQFIVYYL